MHHSHARPTDGTADGSTPNSQQATAHADSIPRMKLRGVLPVVLSTAGLLAACSSGTAPQQTVTVTQPTTVVAAPTVAPAPAATVQAEAPTAAAAGITIPEIPAGTNAEIAKDRLQDLGLTNVDLASANPNYSNVFLPKNWTLVSIEPAPGTVVKADDPVIVKVYKD